MIVQEATRDLPTPKKKVHDAVLIQRMCDRDESALGELHDQWVKSLYSLVMHFLKDSDEAEDVVSETFWQAWTKASSYEPLKGAVSTWLFTIGRRKALDRCRVRGRLRTDPGGGERLFTIAHSSPDPSQNAELSDLRASVMAALMELPQSQKEVIELGYFRGMSQTQIAEATGQPLGTVKTRMRSGLQRLRQPLNGYRQ